MRFILSITLFATLLISSATAQQKIEWMNWNEMVERQQVEPRKIFIDVYTDWCGWCKKMDASTFVDPSVVATMNESFYAVKLDAEMKDSITYNNMVFYNPNPSGKRSVHTLAASLLDSRMSYPSFVILDENFTRLHILAGFQKVPQLMGNLLFFGQNQHLRYQQYLQQQQQRAEAAQQQAAKQ